MTDLGKKDDSNYSKILAKIEVNGLSNPQDVLRTRHNLVMRAMYHLSTTGDALGIAFDILHGGGYFQSDAAAIAVINGWRKLPKHRYEHYDWYEYNSPDAGDTCVRLITDTVEEIRKQDLAYMQTEKRKAAERIAVRKIRKELQNAGYVKAYVNPEDVKAINDARDGSDRLKAVLETRAEGVLVLRLDSR